ncbi:MAG: glycosyltransferase family A protein [Eubacteriales bacterium]
MQLLVSAMNQELESLVKQMKIASNAIIINQCGVVSYESHPIEIGQGAVRTVQCYSFAERGIGLSRNNALLRATDELSLFSDDDIEYVKGYEQLIEEEFAKHTEADVILFQFDVCPSRKTYHTTSYHRVRWHNCGRYPTFSMAIRTSRIHERNITFSLLFGGGAKYSNGEDSLFLQECIRKGLRVYASPILIGREIERPSTWFMGYNEKFFYDRGVLYKHLYGNMAYVFAVRFLMKHKGKMCQTIQVRQAFSHMRRGIQATLRKGRVVS